VLGSGNPTPYDVPLIGVLVALALVLVVGAFTANAWPPGVGTWVRRGALAAGVVATAAVVYVTPTRDGIVGAWRVLSVWPALAAVVLGFLAWSWRAGRL
jgi:hypothetical protein